ncbi:hypothetical protein ACWC9Q_29630 [Streptomyces sp. NPDC001142]
MSITLMTADQRAALAALIGTTNPATALAVSDTVSAAAGVSRSGYSGAAVGRLLALDILALAARLVAVEQLLDTTRRTIARAAATGVDLSISDVLWELEQAGLAITPAELDEAEVLADARAREGIEQ